MMELWGHNPTEGQGRCIKSPPWRAWVAQWVEHLPSAQVLTPGSWDGALLIRESSSPSPSTPAVSQSVLCIEQNSFRFCPSLLSCIVGLHSGAAPAAAAGAAAADRGALQVVPGEAAAVPGQDVLQVHLHPAARRGGACTFSSFTRRFCLSLEGNYPLLHRDFGW